MLVTLLCLKDYTIFCIHKRVHFLNQRCLLSCENCTASIMHAYMAHCFPPRMNRSVDSANEVFGNTNAVRAVTLQHRYWLLNEFDLLLPDKKLRWTPKSYNTRALTVVYLWKRNAWTSAIKMGLRQLQVVGADVTRILLSPRNR